MSKKFTKNTTTAHVKTWDDYQKKRKKEKYKLPLLLPVFVGLNDKTEFEKTRIKANLLGETSDCNSLAGKALESCPEYQRDRFTKICKDYHDYFGTQEMLQSAFPPSPLDFDIEMPVIFMFVLSNDNWCFTGNKQFSTDNDSLANPTVKQMSSFNGMKGILVENDCKAKVRIKYNLHVTICQYRTDPSGKTPELLTTDIIIDPGMDNDTGN